MKISSRTAVRVDFAGGTLDLYPLYLFMGGCTTINAGIDLYSNVEITTHKDKVIEIISEDLNEHVLFDSLDDLKMEGATSLIQRVVKSYAPSMGITIKTRNTAPKGSGLGASSSLLMALSAALLKLNGEDLDLTDIIDRGAAIEAAQLRVPTGKQDYYGALLGGINAIHFDENGGRPESIPLPNSFKKEIQESLLVSYTGISHYSGDNNWDMLKKAVDKTGNTYDLLLKIRDIAFRVRKALMAHDVEKLGWLVSQEWNCRKQLSEGISSPFIDNVIEAAAEAGAWGSKLCGAGGGGCMVSIVPSNKKQQVIKALESKGIEILPAKLDMEGLVIAEYVSAFCKNPAEDYD